LKPKRLGAQAQIKRKVKNHHHGHHHPSSSSSSESRHFLYPSCLTSRRIGLHTCEGQRVVISPNNEFHTAFQVTPPFFKCFHYSIVLLLSCGVLSFRVSELKRTVCHMLLTLYQDSTTTSGTSIRDDRVWLVWVWIPQDGSTGPHLIDVCKCPTCLLPTLKGSNSLCQRVEGSCN
jgi:hypothetical protein